MTVKRMVLDSMFLALIVVCALISFPLGSVPVTLQVLGVFLIIMIAPPLDAILIIFLYALLGTVGLPVFNGGTSNGFGSPTYGFIIGFVVGAIVVGSIRYLFEKREIFKNKEFVAFIIYAVVFIIVLYILGVSYFMMIQKLGIGKAITIFLPFLGIDAAKMVFVFLIYGRLRKIINFEDKKESE